MRDLLKEINFKELEKLNRTTLPKIPVENVFKNKVEAISGDIRKNADEYINSDKSETLPIKSVNVDDIVPTQRNLNIDNLKKVQNVNKNTGAYLLQYQGKFYILDGHHRIGMNILNGNDSVNAYVYQEK